MQITEGPLHYHKKEEKSEVASSFIKYTSYVKLQFTVLIKLCYGYTSLMYNTDHIGLILTKLKFAELLT
jgi:hypothetical protein